MLANKKYFKLYLANPKGKYKTSSGKGVSANMKTPIAQYFLIIALKNFNSSFLFSDNAL